MKVTVRQYFKGFLSLVGLMAGTPFIPPLLRAALSESNVSDVFAGHLFPPLGDLQPVVLFFTVAGLFVPIGVVFFYCRSRRRVRLTLSGVIAGFVFIISVLAYSVLYTSYVRRIPLESVGQERLVSVGYQRTDFALQTYPGKSDDEMLHDRGPWEPEIQKLWTKRSLAVVRTSLWLSYYLALASFVAGGSLFVYKHVSDEISN